MKIPFNKITQRIRTERMSSSGWFSNHSDIQDKDISVWLLCILYHNNVINRESFVNRMKQYDDNKIARRVNTYHSKVIDRWFSDIPLTNVFLEEVIEMCNNKDLTIEEFLTYLNLGFNRNRNWCVDFVAFSIIKPILNHYDTQYILSIVRECGITGIDFNTLTFEDADRNFDLSSGYCCSDCDGCLSQYKRNRYESLYKRDITEELGNTFRDYLMGLKTHLKNPKDKLHWF